MMNLIAIALLFVIGLICLLTQRNLIKLVMGVKILIMGASLSLISAGYARGDTAIAQALVTSILVVEAIVTAVAVALIVNVHRHYRTLDIRELTRLRG
jgi:NADH:ubiquinone oxidoreductase subunit K